MNTLNVKKRNGLKEPYDIDKINKCLSWSLENLENVSTADIIQKVNLNLYDGITTNSIHTLLVQAAKDLLSEDKPNYQYVASRLLSMQLRKQVWKYKKTSENVPTLKEQISFGIEKGIYDSQLLNFTDEELIELNEYINHDRDFQLTYASLQQLIDKYLVQNRVTKEIYETPQFAYMLAAMTVFIKYPDRVKWIKETYDSFSMHKINLPTPQMSGLRTPTRQYSSCMLIKMGDTLDSIKATMNAVMSATASKYGIGVEVSDIRNIGSSIRNGEVSHTGVFPYLKVLEATVRSCIQGGIRGGSATVNVNFFHPEIENIISLKNPAGSEDSKARRLDFTIKLSKLFYTRFIQDGVISLFNPQDCRELYEAFGTPEFDEMYLKLEKNKSKVKKQISAKELMAALVKERTETGRIYILNIDHANTHGTFLDTVQSSNLCTEVIHPLNPLQYEKDPEGLIGICVLSAINMMAIKNDKDLEKQCELIVRILDEVIDTQDYFCPAAERFAINYRSLAVGITNLAAWMAKNNLSYTNITSLEPLNIWMEKFYYYLVKGSIQLAKEKGPCNYYNKTKYSQGILAIDTYKNSVDEIVSSDLQMDWEKLREDLKEYGIRHSSLTSIAPTESSSVVSNATNGIEPIRSFVTFKSSKQGSVPMLAPKYEQLKNKYELAFNLKNNTQIIRISAVLQKYTDMGISTNLYYNYNNYPNNKIPDEEIITDLMYSYKLGLKSLYYSNTLSFNVDNIIEESDCAGGACKI